ncbi:MAG: DNA integrity scanning diadenylate cyclase DisA [Fusobacteriaceae bacterium]|jgi:diadenylate cyclase|nr:DNA integrity scanning diadenylate cyclase DisA [Fusobacteriaceae bacterium]
MDDKMELVEMLAQVSPGTTLRNGIDNIMDGGFGALIIVGYDDEIEKMIDNGFAINCEYTPERLYELAKMDGAIVLDESCKNIIYANVHLQVNRKYTSEESGTRHRTAERAGKQTSKLVVAISGRKKLVSLYKGELKYILKNMSRIIEDANQAVKTLERYKYVLDKFLDNLTILELDDLVTLHDVSLALQRFEMLRRIEMEMKNYISELGTDGRLIKLQYKELLQGVFEEEREFLNDYMSEKLTYEEIHNSLKVLSDVEILKEENFANALGYGKNYAILDKEIKAKGYRVLGKITRLTAKDIEKLTTEYETLADIQEASQEELLDIKMSKIKIKALKNGMQRLKFMIELEREQK